MSRKNRFASPEYAHHVVNRGNERRAIFLERVDYTTFLELLADGARTFTMRVYAYCLMPNHFHLIVQPWNASDLSDFMEYVTGEYACGLRRQTETVGHGHVFQRRFWNAAIADERAFLTVMRYVEGNAHRSCLVQRAEEWEWSSLRDRDERRDILSP
jgi:putative transposase